VPFTGIFSEIKIRDIQDMRRITFTYITVINQMHGKNISGNVRSNWIVTVSTGKTYVFFSPSLFWEPEEHVGFFLVKKG